MADNKEQNTVTERIFARRGLDGLAQIGLSKFDLMGLRFVTDNESNDSGEESEEVDTDEVETDAEETVEETEGDDPFAEERTKLTGTLTKVRGENRELKKANKALKAQLAEKSKPVDESEIDAAKREAAAEASKKADERILRSEIRAAATGKFADPKDALAFLDLTEFEVDENGDVDSDAIEDALTNLLEKKPHLGVAPKRFQGGGHQGAKAPAKLSQLTAEQYNAMSRDEKRKARNEGRVNKILGAN